MKNMKSNFICTFPKDSNHLKSLFRGNYKISIYIQDTLHKKKILKLKDCKLWLRTLHALVKTNPDTSSSSITIRIVGEKESESLNYNYRNQKNFMMKGYQSNQSPFSVLTIPSSCQPIERFCQYSQPYHLR